MAKIQINNPRQIINGGAKKYYFKVKGLGGPKGDKGDKGDTGSQGPQGPQGNAATVSIGSTTTLPVGYDATVTNSGSIYNAVLDFGIPQGPQGPQGAKGDKGDTGAQGETGPRGPQGERGTNATVSIGTTYTLNPGSQATVYNSGSDSNAVLNFGIPRGDVGPQPELVQTTGTSTTKAMSQNATTVALAAKQNTIDSSHKLSADLVDDTSTTNKFVTAEDKTTWNAKQNALTAGDNIEITGDTISTTAIAPEVVAELPTTGAEGKLYLTPKNYTRSTATGNPITATVAEEAGKMESFQLDGDAFQQTYTGQNLYDVSTLATGSSVTVDSDGWITATKDNSAGSSSSYTNIWTNNLELKTNTQYAIFLEVKAVSGEGELDITSTNSTQGQFSSWQSKQIASLRAGTYKITGTTKSSFSGVYGGLRTILNLSAGQSASITFRLSVLADTSASTSSFVYEPYTGGQASPNPSYPQQIQTVTGEQTVEIVGKNLIDPDGLELGNIDASGNDSDSQQVVRSGYIRVAAGSYTLKVNNSDNNINLWRYAIYDNSKTFVSANTPQAKSATITIANNGYIRVSFYNVPWKDLTVQEIIDSQVQLELGSTASAYTPYTSTSYPISLGTIELCKLGTYQDRIYKDGNDWKIHKETDFATIDSLSDGSSHSLSVASENTTRVVINQCLNGQAANIRAAEQASIPYRFNRFIPKSVYGSDVTGAFVDTNSELTKNGFVFRALKTEIGTTDAEVEAWLNTHPLEVHYALAAPTDEVITNTALIAQLEAIRTASLEDGTNTITNTATGTNLAGDMEIGYYGFNPRNRYDKWLWLDINNNYEQIGS